MIGVSISTTKDCFSGITTISPAFGKIPERPHVNLDDQMFAYWNIDASGVALDNKKHKSIYMHDSLTLAVFQKYWIINK